MRGTRTRGGQGRRTAMDDGDSFFLKKKSNYVCKPALQGDRFNQT